jgi:hypothetical protein
MDESCVRFGYASPTTAWETSKVTSEANGDRAASTARLTEMLHNAELESRFTRVYAKNLWEDPETISGPGSRLGSEPVVETLDALRMICRTHDIGTLNDIPCGDLNWVAKFLSEFPTIRYTGFDIVQPLIDRNLQLHPDIACRMLDITSHVPPKADLVLCKDLIIHLNDEDIHRTLANIKASGSTWLLASNNFGMPNDDLRENQHGDSACRYVDVLTAPFHYSPPLWRTQYLGLWKLADLHAPPWA